MTMSMYRKICVTNRALAEHPFLEQLACVLATKPYAMILREKDLSEKEYEELAKKVMAICAEYKVPCILHTFWRVAEKLKCDTVHLPLPILRQFVLEKQNQKNQKYRESQNLSIPESQKESEDDGSDACQETAHEQAGGAPEDLPAGSGKCSCDR